MICWSETLTILNFGYLATDLAKDLASPSLAVFEILDAGSQPRSPIGATGGEAQFSSLRFAEAKQHRLCLFLIARHLEEVCFYSDCCYDLITWGKVEAKLNVEQTKSDGNLKRRANADASSTSTHPLPSRNHHPHSSCYFERFQNSRRGRATHSLAIITVQQWPDSHAAAAPTARHMDGSGPVRQTARPTAVERLPLVHQADTQLVLQQAQALPLHLRPGNLSGTQMALMQMKKRAMAARGAALVEDSSRGGSSSSRPKNTS